MTEPRQLPSAVLDVLERGGIPYQLISHTRTETAAAEARALGFPERRVAKTIVLASDDGFARVVLPASERVDLDKVRRVLGTDDIALASEQALTGAYPEFELGAVPPLGGPRGDRVIVDRRLRDESVVACDAGVHDQSLLLSTTDLIELAHGEVADVCSERPR